MRPQNVLHLYRVRLVQELFAIVGIAAGVALLFASQVASQSLSSSVTQLSHGIVGDATLQLLAGDPHGMPEGVLSEVRRGGARSITLERARKFIADGAV